tara:strand:+ start:695 stop:805 length:111 start_codon:yes stop_codon:yes gene_type:complete
MKSYLEEGFGFLAFLIKTFLIIVFIYMENQVEGKLL